MASLIMKGAPLQNVLNLFCSIMAIGLIMIAMVLTVLSSSTGTRIYNFRRTLTLFVCLPTMVLYVALILAEQGLPTLNHYRIHNSIYAVTEYMCVVLLAVWPLTWAKDDHSDSQSYYVAQMIFGAEEKYHLAHPVYKMINRKFPEINPSNFDRNSDRKVSKKKMADKMKQAKIGDDDTDALAASKKPKPQYRPRPKGPPTGPDGVNWQWQNRGKWKSFDPQDQGLVEEKYIIFSKGQGEVHDVVLGGSWNYSLHFGKMTQMNRKSKAIKKIKRDGPSVDITWKMGAKSKEPASPSFDPVPAWMQPGAVAQLTGLENAPKLNGNVVKIESNKPEPPEGKIRVTLSKGTDDGGSHIWGGEAKVKPENLKPDSGAPPAAPPAAPAAAPAVAPAEASKLSWADITDSDDEEASTEEPKPQAEDDGWTTVTAKKGKKSRR